VFLHLKFWNIWQSSKKRGTKILKEYLNAVYSYILQKITTTADMRNCERETTPTLRHSNDVTQKKFERKWKVSQGNVSAYLKWKVLSHLFSILII